MQSTNHKHGQLPMAWHCDFCGEFIANIADGWVEWLAAEEDDDGHTTLAGVRVVHQMQNCRYDHREVFRARKSIVEGLPLERFVGPDGLMLLFYFLNAGEFRKEELLELAKRVQIPGYERMRHVSRTRASQNSLMPLLGQGFCLQWEICEFMTKVDRERRRSRLPRG